MSVIVTVYNPDGSQRVHPASKRPLEYERRDEHRAFLSALKAWWPTGPEAIRLKRVNDPKWGHAPEGSTMHLNGRLWKRLEQVPVFEGGVLVDTRLDWVDVADKVEAQGRAERVAAMAAKLGIPVPENPNAWKEASMEEEVARGSVTDAMLARADAELAGKRGRK